MLTFNDLVQSNSRDTLCSMFACSKPTLQRWISTNQYPSYVDKIIMLNNQISIQSTKIFEQRVDINTLKKAIRTYINAKDELIDLSK